jgi:hypothetical protein
MEEVNFDREYEITLYRRGEGLYVAEMFYAHELLFLGTGDTEEEALDALLAAYKQKMN